MATIPADAPQPSVAHLTAPADAPSAWGAAPNILYLNRAGAFVQPGQMSDSRTNRSPLIPQPVQIPPFSWGDAAWGEFVTCVRGQFARYAVTVTDADPGAADHIEAIVGGNPAAIGQPFGVAGYAASYCGAVDTNGVEFVFPDAIPHGNVQLLCEVAAQELAHAFSLDHETLCSDPMSYCLGGAPKAFQDVDATCGESGARPCRCGGLTQNSHRMLLAAMGPSDGTFEPPPIPPASGTRPDGAGCFADTDCASGACRFDPALGAVCVSSCTSDEACGYQEYCSPDPVTGGVCRVDIMGCNGEGCNAGGTAGPLLVLIVLAMLARRRRP